MDSRARRAERKAQFPRAFRCLDELVATADPLGLLACGFPADEHHPEVGTDLPRLPACRSAADVRTVLHEEFVRWFGAANAGPREAYAELAEAVWRDVRPLLAAPGTTPS